MIDRQSRTGQPFGLEISAGGLETKLRYEAQTSYEANVTRPALAAGQRGIVLAPPVRLEGNAITSSDYSKHDLHSALLLWDAIDYPANNAVEVSNADLKSLEDLGALVRTRVEFSGRFSGEDLPKFSVAALDALDHVSPGRWSMYRRKDGLSFSGADLVDRGGIDVALANAIPVPIEGLPFAELLEFREKRRDELLALRSRLDELAQKVALGPDHVRELVRAIDDMDRAISDQIKVSAERFAIGNFLQFKMSVDLKGAGMAGASALAVGLPLTAAAAAGIAAGIAPNLEIGTGRGRKKPRSGTPYEYVVSMREELGG